LVIVHSSRKWGTKIRKLTQEEFLLRLKDRLGDKYDYSHVEYTGMHNNVILKCPIHGEWRATPSNLLRASIACPECIPKLRTNKTQISQDEFLCAIKNIHGDKYDFTSTKYVNYKTRVIVRCRIHGEWLAYPTHLLHGSGCKKCAIDALAQVRRLTTNEYIVKAKAVHGDTYLYDLIDYKNTNTKIQVVCRKHGKWKTSPSTFLAGSGCPKCKHSSGENKIQNYLEHHNIPYVAQYKDHECKVKNKLSFDFAVFSDEKYTDLSALVEFDGAQHYIAVDYFGGEERLNKIQKYDAVKNEYCLTNNIKLIRIPYTEMENINSILDRELKIEN